MHVKNEETFHLVYIFKIVKCERIAYNDIINWVHTQYTPLSRALDCM